MGVFVSYGRRDGAVLAKSVVDVLREHSISVTWDQDVPSSNPSSIHEWMDAQVATNIVVCVVSPAYAEYFAEGASSNGGRGVLYEARAIRAKLHSHTAPDSCPVIPVVDVASDASVPDLISRLHVTTVNPMSGEGTEELVQRVRAIEGSASAAGSSSITGAASPLDGLPPEQQVRQLLARLEQSRGAPEAAETVRTLLDLAARYPDRTAHDLADGFAYAEKAIKAVGDFRLMRRLTEACLAAVDRASPQLERDRALRARILICGRGWHLQREDRLEEALRATQEGVHLAANTGQPLTEAFGNKCLGRLYRLLAEGSHDSQDKFNHLHESVRRLRQAYSRFLELNGSALEEAGDAKCLEGRTLLVEYRLTADAQVLQSAVDCVQEAERLIPVKPSKDYYDLVILQAEVDVEQRRVKQARRALDDAIERLRKRPEASYSEILARALQVRAYTQTVLKGRDVHAGLRDARESQQIFEQVGMPRAAAASRWMATLLDPREVSVLPVAQAALVELGFMEPDPAMRLAALAELADQERDRVGRPIGRRTSEVNWESILAQVCPLRPHTRRGAAA